MLPFMFHYIFAPFITLLIVGLIPFLFLNRNRYKVSAFIGILHFVIMVVSFFIIGSMGETILRIFFVYLPYFATIKLLDESNLNRSKFAFIYLSVIIAELIGRGVFY